MATRIKVKVKYLFKAEAIAKVLPVGFETTLQPVYQNDKFLHYSFNGADGNTYDTSEIDRWIGVKPLSFVFDKI